MKILFLNPPQVFSKTQVCANVTPPLGLMYLASFIREKGHEVDFIDATVEKTDQITDLKNDISIRGLTLNEIVKKVDTKTDLIGISNLFSLTFPVIVELVDNLKNAYPDMKIVLGGAHPSALPKLCLEKSKADFVIIGEGEFSLNKLIDCLENKTRLEDIDGVAYKKESKIIINPKTNYIKDLDSLPFPARDLVNWEKYHSTHEAHGPTQEPWTPILSSIGCPFKCTFCTSRVKSPNVRTAISCCDFLIDKQEIFYYIYTEKSELLLNQMV